MVVCCTYIDMAGYIPKCVVVTGGCGFIGSNFINHVAEIWKEARIVNYDKMTVCSDAFNVNNVK